MSETQSKVASRAGRYVFSHFFFSRSVRGGFAYYERPAEGGSKWCVRAEARGLGEESRLVMTYELDHRDLAPFVAVLRGQRDVFRKRIGSPGRSPKELIIRYNAAATPPNGWVMTASKDGHSHSVGFDSEAAWKGQVYAIYAAKAAFPEISDDCLWQIIAGTGKAAPTEKATE